MEEFIKIENKDLFFFNAELLGIKEAQLWIGRPDGPLDNEDKKVLERREEDKKLNPILGIEAVNLRESNRFPGWFEVDTSAWPEGIYRLMIHSKAGVQAPNGTKLNPQTRDLQYSWPKIDEDMARNLNPEQRSFIYQEPNKAGFCFRIEITKNRDIEPAGNVY